MNDFREYIGCCNSLYNYVKHHGIKGQKWGVRNGPPYPIEDTVLKAGTKVEHVSRYYTAGNSQTLLDYFNNSKKMLYVYNPNDKWDKKIYQGPFAKFLKDYRMRTTSNPEVHQFTVKEDLKMPKELDSVKQILIDGGFNLNGNTDYAKVDFNNIKTEEDIKNAYMVFNHAMEVSYKYSITQAYCQYMCQRFDAMVDDNNVNIYNRAHDPIIILNTQKLLASKKIARQLKDIEIAKNCGDVRRELNKYGERMKL